MGTTLFGIDTPYIVLPFGSILYHLGKVVTKQTKSRLTVKYSCFPTHKQLKFANFLGVQGVQISSKLNILKTQKKTT